MPADYQAALNGVAYFPQPQAGCLRVTGEDRLDFLQRQTSNDLRRLSAAALGAHRAGFPDGAHPGCAAGGAAGRGNPGSHPAGAWG